jgi:protein MpaA
MIRPILRALVLCGLGCGLIGCVGADPAPASTNLEASSPLAVGARTIGTSVQGRPIEARRYGTGPIAVLILATIHGNEPAGTPLLQAFEAALASQPRVVDLERYSLTIVDIVNPDGYAQTTRTNPRGVDLNRNFPADNFAARARHGEEPLSEPESRALHQLILELMPARVVSFHQPLRCIDFDGPGEGLARRIATLSGLPYKKLGSRPGSLGAWCGETLGIPIICWEFAKGEEKKPPSQLWAEYGPALLAFIRGETEEPRG